MVEHEWVITGVVIGPSPYVEPEVSGPLRGSDVTPGIFECWWRRFCNQKWAVCIFFGGGWLQSFLIVCLATNSWKGVFFSEGGLYIVHIYVNSYFYMRVIHVRLVAGQKIQMRCHENLTSGINMFNAILNFCLLNPDSQFKRLWTAGFFFTGRKEWNFVLWVFSAILRVGGLLEGCKCCLVESAAFVLKSYFRLCDVKLFSLLSRGVCYRIRTKPRFVFL